MEVEVGENKRHGGDDYCYNIALGFEEICEHGDEEQYAEQDGEEALPVRKREADKARQHLEGAAAVGYEHGHKRVLAAEIAEAIAPQFPDTDLEFLTAVCQRHLDIDAWNATPVMKSEALDRLMDVMESAGELESRVEFDALVDNTYAEAASW